MKTKTKLAVLSLALSATVVGMVGAATFAWFSARTYVSTNFSTITINAKDASLSATIYPLGGVALNNTSGSIEMTSANESFTGDYALHDTTSDFGEYFIRFANNRYYRITDNDIPKYACMVGVAISNLAIGNPANLTVCPFWRAHDSNSTVDVKTAQNMRFCALQCTDATFTTIKPDAVRHAFVYDEETDPLTFHTYDAAQGQVVSGSYQEGQYSFRDDIHALTQVQQATTNYFRIAFWFDGEISQDQDECRGGKVDLSVTFSMNS